MSNFIPDAPVGADSGRWKPVVRGFVEGTEVLTEAGWVDFRVLYSADYLSEPVPFVGNGLNAPGWGVKDLRWGQWKTGAGFPRVGTVDPSTGKVMFVYPSRFMFYEYEGRLVHVKMKGVDFLCSLFTDLWLKPKYGRSWKFVLADDVVRNVHSNVNYQLLNKFNVDMYGFWSPTDAGVLGEPVMLPVVGGGSVEGVSSSIVSYVGSPIVVYPKKHVKRRRVWDFFDYDTVDPVTGERVKVDRVRVDVPVFNMVVPPFHNIIVRRGRADDNPRTLWVGGPVVVGDGLDKSLLRVAAVGGLNGSPLGGSGMSGLVGLDGNVLGVPNAKAKNVGDRAGSAGGSYGSLRPDYRNTGVDRFKDRF